MDPVVHFEMGAKDTKRMMDFYAKSFGWQTNQLGEEYGNYITVMTSENGPDNFPKERGRINGGFFKRTQDEGQAPRVVIAVDDIHASMKKVEEAGGKIVGGGRKAGEPDDIPNVGLYITVEDTEGNRISLLQPSNKM